MKILTKVAIFIILFSLTPMRVLSAESAGEIITDAKNLHKQADSLQGAWLSTGKLIKEAEKALMAGKNESALQIAKKARIEAELSVRQSKVQQSSWSEPKYLK